MYGNENKKRAYSLGWTSSLGLLYEHTTDCGLQTTEIHFYQSWSLGSPRSSHQQIQCPTRDCFLVHARLSFIPAPHGRGTREFPGVFFLRALISFMRVLPSWPNHLPKTTPPSNSTLGIKFQRMNLGVGIQSMANHMYLPDLNNFDLHKQHFQVVQPNRYSGDWSEYVRGPCQPLLVLTSFPPVATDLALSVVCLKTPYGKSTNILIHRRAC